ncbi:MAG: OB-fold domain-containing protein [Proteobacteria bacterium]|nr:OB-fold domain-containing protein [Pseudomonadota bacterium]
MEALRESPAAAYVAHLEKGELAYQVSASTGQVVFYPRVIAPVTGAADLEWRISKGLGTVHATTVVHPQKGEPYNVALIDVDEGFRMMSRVEDILPAAVKIGMRVRMRVHREPEGSEDPPYPVFFPVESA